MNWLLHLLFPRESNNHKAHILHAPSILVIIAIFCVYQFSIQSFSNGSVLGYASNISIDEVIKLTNEKRAEAGVGPVNEDPLLMQAAQEKATDMINKDYWAHVAPDGTQPWKFFNDVGYKYRYAGENLARDFKDPSSVVNAWMASPSHRENMLSDRYKDIGLAVIDGRLTGSDTTLVVEMFGRKVTDTIPVTPVAAAENKPTALTIPTAVPQVSGESAGSLEPTIASSTVTKFDLSKAASLVLTVMLGLIIAVDAFIVARKKIVRIGGRTFAHLSFFGMIIAVIIIAKAGRIL